MSIDIARRYLIVTPDYDEKSAGIWVLHKLCNDLNILQPGTAYVMCGKTNPDWNTPIGRDLANLMRDGILIYPEAFNDTLGHNGRVVRYILNKPGYCSPRTKVLPVDDFHLCFSRIFRSPEKPADQVLFMPHLADELCIDKHLPRESMCWYIGKSSPIYNENPNRAPKHIGLQQICWHMQEDHILLPNDRSWPLSALIDVFNRCKLFFCYDNMTAVFKIATMCGCPTIIIPNGMFQREEFEQSEWGLDGLAWGVSELEIQRAVATVNKSRAWYEIIKREYWSSLQEFVKKTQMKFK